MTTKYQRLADHLLGPVRQGLVRPGDRVPSIRELAAEWGETTAKTAMAMLKAQGWVVATPGAGTTWADPLPERASEPVQVEGLAERLVRLEEWAEAAQARLDRLDPGGS